MIRAKTHPNPYCAFHSDPDPTLHHTVHLILDLPNRCQPLSPEQTINQFDPVNPTPSFNLSITPSTFYPSLDTLSCPEQCVRLFIYRLGSVEIRLVPSSGKSLAERTGIRLTVKGRSFPRNMVSRQTVPTRVHPICNWSESTSTTTRHLPTSMCPEPSLSIWSQEPWTLSEVVL